MDKNKGLPMDTIIEVIAIHKKTGKASKKEMKYGEWLNMKDKNENYHYTAFQVGKEAFTKQNRNL